MGTQFDILMVGSDPRLLGTVWEKVESEVQRLDKMLNRFDPESEVSSRSSRISVKKSRSFMKRA
jgi:thiamine biosynthesis lipoprotein